MSARQHARNASSAHKTTQQQQSRSARLNLSTKKTNNSSYTPAPLSPSKTRPSAGRTSSRTVETEIIYTDELVEDDAMASFLQFCPTCEKQIPIPSISVLYCSEACRRRDSVKSIPHTQYSPPLSPYGSALHDHPLTTIIPRRSPTILRPLSMAMSELSLCELVPRPTTPINDVDESTFGMPTRSARPYVDRNNSSDDSAQLPSLIHSPASSFGASASHLECDRPLPRKHSCQITKGIDLVMPISGTSWQMMTTSTASEQPRRKSAPANSIGKLGHR